MSELHGGADAASAARGGAQFIPRVDAGSPMALANARAMCFAGARGDPASRRGMSYSAFSTPHDGIAESYGFPTCPFAWSHDLFTIGQWYTAGRAPFVVF